MNDNEMIIDLYFKSIKKMNEIEGQPRDYGTGDLLYSSEIHTLEGIGKNPGCNLTELSDQLGITKGGTSKFLKKLLTKELIIKEKLPNNRKETLYRLTSKGEIAYRGHDEFSQKMFSGILKKLSQLSSRDSRMIREVFEALNSDMNGH